MQTLRIAVIGAGPVGIEAALRGVDDGHDVHLYEAGRVGEHIRRWGHVRMFSPWPLERSALGARCVLEAGGPSIDARSCPTGHEYVRDYLEPLARHPRLVDRVHEGTRVVRIGRDGLGKSDLLGGPRHAHPFRLLLEDRDGERISQADVVLDCSGTFGNPNWMGNGNVPAPGERSDDRYSVELSGPGGNERLDCDRILALVGYSPDNDLYRELQVHECFATLGPMALATTLLGQDSADCLAQPAAGLDTLRNPEPRFFVLGAKSYGRNPSFLIRIGFDQVREVFDGLRADLTDTRRADLVRESPE